MACAALRGSRSPTATSHSSWLPTATVTWGRARATASRASSTRVPEHRAVVEVEHRDPVAAARLERGERGAAARLLREPGDGGPEHARGADRVEVELLGTDLEIGRLGLTVEVQREVVGREDLAERDRRGEALDRRDVAVVDAEAAQRVVQELAERVLARARDHGGAAAVAGGGDGDVGRAAAEVLAERLDLAQRDARLQRVDVDADPAHRQDVEHVAHHPAFARSHSRLARCSPAACAKSPLPSSTRSCSITTQPS